MESKTYSQLSIIRRYLLSGKSITPIEAFNLCKCFRLSAIIYRLRHNESLPIRMEQPEADKGKQYAKYYIDRTYFQKQQKICFTEKGGGV